MLSMVGLYILSTKINIQLGSCELFYLRTAAQEAASQIALRDCSKATVGGSQYIQGFGEGGVQYHEALILQKLFISREDLMSP